jgi:hypothetical protein
MYVVKNSERALFVALIPLAVVHAVLLAMALLATKAMPSQAIMPPPDKILLHFAGRLALDGVLLFGGHLALRQFNICSRAAYALIGGAMAATSYLLAMRNGLLMFSVPVGSEIAAGLLPAAAGVLAGFLYGQFAGLVTVAAAPRVAVPAAAEPASAPRVFDGPVRVRTSVGAIAIAATAPAALSAVLVFMFMVVFGGMAGTEGPGAIFAAALPAQIFLTALIGTSVPSAILMLAAHHIARALNLGRGGEYAAIGSLVAGGCVVLLTPLLPIHTMFLFLAIAVVNGAIMGALYRRFAGIEPVPLPEVVIATDPQALVGADHPSRHQHGVILSN